MANSEKSTVEQVDEILARSEKELRDELTRIMRARDALGKRRGRRPQQLLTTKG